MAQRQADPAQRPFRRGPARIGDIGPDPVAIAGIFVVVAFIYVNNMSLMLRVAEFESLTANGTGGWRLNADDRTLVPRFLHILVGAVAVAGAGAALLGWLRRHRDPAFGMWAMRYGSGWTALATFANLFFGSWWLMSLPRDVLMRFVGHDAAATTVLMLGTSPDDFTILRT